MVIFPHQWSSVLGFLKKIPFPLHCRFYLLSREYGTKRSRSFQRSFQFLGRARLKAERHYDVVVVSFLLLLRKTPSPIPTHQDSVLLAEKASPLKGGHCNTLSQCAWEFSIFFKILIKSKRQAGTHSPNWLPGLALAKTRLPTICTSRLLQRLYSW